MGLVDGLQETLMSPLNKLTEYKDNEIPKMQKQTANEGKVPDGIPEKIKQIQKYKKTVDKITTALRAIENTILAIEVAKGVAEAAKAAGQIGSALVPPAAAASVLQEKIVEKVKEEIAEAKAQLKSIDLIKDELLKVIIAIIIALLALRARGGDKSGKGTNSGNDVKNDKLDKELQDELTALESEVGDSVIDEDDSGGGLQTIVKTTTAQGTTQTGGTGGTGGGGSTGGGGGY